MADRRMFAKDITESDEFLDMSLSTQALYFHLGMNADDDGFVKNPKIIQKMIGAANDDFKVLLTKKYIIAFESGVIVITHWKINNYIRKDRYKSSYFKKEKNQLFLNEQNEYILSSEVQDSNIGIPNVNQRVYPV